jgi:hypothetical protein
MSVDALNVYASLTGTSTKAKLREGYGGLIESIQKNALSVRLKNARYSGNPEAGSVKVSRFVNSKSQAYGTARAAGEGNPLRDLGVVVNVDTDKEIIEEIEAKDIRFSPVEGVVANRIADHDKTVVRELDSAFFAAVEAVADAEVTLTAGALEAQLEELIQSMETLSNDFVDGVDRDLMDVTLTPAVYGVLRTKFDPIVGVNGETIGQTYHGVRVWSNIRQTKDFVLIVDGAVAQPVVLDEYAPSRIPLSNAAAVELFYHYGTKVVAEDLVLWAEAAATESV